MTALEGWPKLLARGCSPQRPIPMAVIIRRLYEHVIQYFVSINEQYRASLGVWVAVHFLRASSGASEMSVSENEHYRAFCLP